MEVEMEMEFSYVKTLDWKHLIGKLVLLTPLRFRAFRPPPKLFCVGLQFDHERMN